jgi:hypothetical protein
MLTTSPNLTVSQPRKLRQINSRGAVRRQTHGSVFAPPIFGSKERAQPSGEQHSPRQIQRKQA